MNLMYVNDLSEENKIREYHYLTARLRWDRLDRGDRLFKNPNDEASGTRPVIFLPLDDRSPVTMRFLISLIEGALSQYGKRFPNSKDAPKVITSVTGSGKDVIYYHISLDDWSLTNLSLKRPAAEP